MDRYKGISFGGAGEEPAADIEPAAAQEPVAADDADLEAETAAEELAGLEAKRSGEQEEPAVPEDPSTEGEAAKAKSSHLPESMQKDLRSLKPLFIAVGFILAIGIVFVAWNTLAHRNQVAEEAAQAAREAAQERAYRQARGQAQDIVSGAAGIVYAAIEPTHQAMQTAAQPAQAEQLAQEEADRQAKREAARQAYIEENDLANRTPFKGMNASYIDETGLGPHEKEETIDDGQWKGGTSYGWYSKNGKHDYIFLAIVYKGEVVKGSRFKTASNYWPDGAQLPDVYASGDPKPKEQSGDTKPSPLDDPVGYDPFDYESPGVYADEAEYWFKDHGYEEPWWDAYHFWEENCLEGENENESESESDQY